MIIVAISDTHGTHKELKMPDGDILIHCGDGLDWGIERELISLNEWFGTLNYKKILYVPGNHDIIFEEETDHAKNLMTNATVLIDELINIDGFKIYGSPWTPRYGDWAFMKPDLNLINHWADIPQDIDVLVTHGPPYGILDRNNRGDLCGSQTLMKAVFEKLPRYHVFGHIHEGSGYYGNVELGKHYIEPTTFINAAIQQNWFDVVEKQPRVFEV